MSEQEDKSAEIQESDLAESEVNTAENTEISIEQELRETQEKYLRSLADFENHRKRALKERSELLKYQGERIFQDLLDVVDNFDLALNHQDCDAEQMRQGMQLIHQLLQSFLNKWEVRGVSSIGQAFDPNSQNAISTAPAVGGVQAGQVIAELKRAFFYKDKLLRPGEVIVAVEPSSQDQ